MPFGRVKTLETTEREARQFLLSKLVACSFCRKKTAQRRRGRLSKQKKTKLNRRFEDKDTRIEGKTLGGGEREPG